MKASEVMAERALLFVSPDGKEVRASVQIGMPYPKDGQGICCDCEVPGITEREYSAGIDGIQAILLVISLVEAMLDAKCSKGWRILWPDTREQTTPKELFGSSK